MRRDPLITTHPATSPIVFAIVDFDGGGRLPVELTDVNADELKVGDPVEMTFRRLFTADGIHNYFQIAVHTANPVTETGLHQLARAAHQRTG